MYDKFEKKKLFFSSFLITKYMEDVTHFLILCLFSQQKNLALVHMIKKCYC